MKTLKITAKLTIIILLLSACSKENPRVFYFDETGCLNPWDDDYSADTFSIEALSETIHTFLIDEGIDVESVEIGFDSSKVELCYACHCKTGRVISVKATRGDRRKLKKLHFYE
tara:strand:+ start:685 stop:1026 length:342 start_codon:yes stop_codon:yes gene_type:complete